MIVVLSTVANVATVLLYDEEGRRDHKIEKSDPWRKLIVRAHSA
jgi:hypothetical protein